MGKEGNEDVWDNNQVKGKGKGKEGKEDVWDRWDLAAINKWNHEAMAKAAGKSTAKAKAKRQPVVPDLFCKPHECGFAGSYMVIHHCPPADLAIEISGGDPSRKLEEWVVTPHGPVTLPVSFFSEGSVRTLESSFHPVRYSIIELIDNAETELLRATQQAIKDGCPAPCAYNSKYDPSRSLTTQRTP